MLRKLIAAWLVVFVLVPGGWLLVEHFRGRARLAAVLDAQKARGEVFDVDRFLVSEPSGASNAMPELMAAAKELGNASGVIPPAIRMVAPGRAIPPNRLEHWEGRPKTNTWEDVAVWVSDRGEAFDRLRDALEAPARRPNIDSSVGFAKMLLPHLPTTKNAVTALALSAADASRRRDLDAALADLNAARVIQSDLAGESILISQLVRVACASIVNARIWSLVHAADWDEAQLARIQASLPRKDLTSALVRSLEGERALCLIELKRVSSAELADIWLNPDQMMAMLGGGGGASLEVPTTVDEAVELAGTLVQRIAAALRSRVLVPIWRFGWGDQAAAYYLETLDTMIRANRDAVRASSQAVIDEGVIGAILNPSHPYVRLRSVFASALSPALLKATAKGFRAETEIGLNEAGIAILRFRKTHGHPPDSLAELVPQFLAEVPRDYMDGKPLRYRREGTDRFVLWSLGANGKDDGGNALWPKGNTMVQWWTAHDAVWPQPASAEDIAEWEAKENAKARRTAGSGGLALSPELMKRYGLMPKPPAAAATDARTTGTNVPAPPAP